MRFRFDANQEYQITAIDAVCDLFQGQARLSGGMRFDTNGASMLAAVANRLDLDDSVVLGNLRAIQKRNRIRPDRDLQHIQGTVPAAGGERQVRFANFSVEMETGTGKTYVYFRTMLELNRRYGFRKYIVVVPSVAVREGVLKTFEVTREHFRVHFDNPPVRCYVYDSANLSQVRQFALSDAVEIMVMTIDSFNKAANVIRQITDRLQGETPIHLVQAARPILVLDEPQNMESEKSIAALAALDPLLALRYSATHRNPYNVVYRLTPAEAYRQGLVKKIEVDSVVRENDVNLPYVRVEDITTEKRTLKAKLRVHKLQKDGTVKETSITVKPGDSLVKKTERKEYDGFDVDEISVFGGFVRFANQVEVKNGEETGADRKEIFAAQIEATIDTHFKKQMHLKEKGIKVLSLFFIDRVANYIGDDNGPGLIRRLFNEKFDALKQRYAEWQGLSPDDAQAAYFAQKRRKSGEIELLDSKTGEAEDDRAAYELIMKKKEALLSFPDAVDDVEAQRDKRVAFIFSHSALREGWDNPNVFQICTLNHTASPMKKRQEIGRGVRLAVDQVGERVRDDQVNVLTVVANESYRDYVVTLQDEIAAEYRQEIEARCGKAISDLTDAERRRIEQEYGEGILPPKPRQAGKNKAKLRKERVLSEEFKALWDRIKHRTRYAVRLDTDKLLNDVIPELNGATIAPPRVSIIKASVNVSEDGVFEAMQSSAARTAADLAGRYPLPDLVDVMANLMEHTSPPVKLTRRTLMAVYDRYAHKNMVLDNPHEWASVAVRVLKDKLAEHLVQGIQYEKDGRWYDMSQILADDEIELFCEHIGEPDTEKDKTIYDLIPCDSGVEEEFVRQLEERRDVRLYVKLPRWFVVPTPVGDYRPDWAIVMEGPEQDGKPILYLVAETKGTTNLAELRPEERRKILCGAAHFGSKSMKRPGALEGVDYRVVSSADQLR